MAQYTNYLTSYTHYLRRHITKTFKFNDTSGLTNEEIKSYIRALTTQSAVPIANATFEWLATIFRYVRDRDRMYVYDNTLGLWHYENDEVTLVNVLTDYFTMIAEIAKAARDRVMEGYAQYFFTTASKINTLAKRVMTSIHLLIPTSSGLVEDVFHLRYFNTTDGRRALMDMNQPTFNLTIKRFHETQDLLLQHIAPSPISTTDEEPTLWLSLIAEYMLHDQARIDYFYKVLAYMMAPYNYNQVFIYFIGDGRNGKSTIIKVLQDILGPAAIRMNSELLDANPPSSFKKDDALAATEGKSLLIFNEIDERIVASTRNIKDLTEGGRDEFGNKIMTVVRPAYSPNYEVNIAGTPVILANSLLNFGEWSALDPIFKRLVLVPFEYKIKKEDPTILNRLAQEYPKIQAWLYLNYFKHKGILIKDEPKPYTTQKMMEQYRDDSDIINLFWRECIDITAVPTDKVLRGDLYRMYRQYCNVNGRRAIKNKGTNGFSNLIKKQIESAVGVVETLSNGSYYITGIKTSNYYTQEVKNFG